MQSRVSWTTLAKGFLLAVIGMALKHGFQGNAKEIDQAPSIDSDQAHRNSVYSDYQKQLFAIRMSNIEKSDAAILTLSSGVLALSMTFLKQSDSDIGFKSPWIIIFTWIFLLLSIVAVLWSFHTGRKSAEKADALMHEWCCKGDNKILDSFDKQIPEVRYTQWLNATGAILFCIALGLAVVFASKNLN